MRIFESAEEGTKLYGVAAGTVVQLVVNCRAEPELYIVVDTPNSRASTNLVNLSTGVLSSISMSQRVRVRHDALLTFEPQK